MTDHRYTPSELEDMGFPLSGLTPEQLEVLRDLTAEEAALLLDIKARMDHVAPEVQAHTEIAGAALF
jgi:hypothetical protein